jgi:hypothetical protein
MPLTCGFVLLLLPRRKEESVDAEGLVAAIGRC